jgi:tetratricopeptide (TPR) repeat protein
VQYNCRVRVRNYLYVTLILAGLIAAVLGPIIYRALNDLKAGQSAEAQGRFAEAAQLFESAAGRLFWRNDLWEQAGLADYHIGDRQNAIRLLEIARQRSSISAPGWDALGSAYWDNNQHPLALSIWKSGSQIDPSYKSLLDHLALAYHAIADYPSEQDALTKRLALGEDASAHYRLGLILTLSDLRQAQKELSAARSLDSGFDPAVQTLQTALNLASLEINAAPRAIVIGRGLGLVEEWGLADRAFEQAVAADANNAEAWAWSGEARQHIGQDGRMDLDKALALAPGDALIRELRGVYWKRQGNYAQALMEYLRAAQIEPDNPAWQGSLGDAYSQTGDLVSALAAYQNAVSLAPNDATYLRLLAIFCSDNNVHVMDIGLPAAQKAAELAPKDPQALDALGWSDLQAGYLNGAQQSFIKAIEISPDIALTHLHLAETYLKKGELASAFDELNLARQLDRSGPTGQMAGQLLAKYFP